MREKIRITQTDEEKKKHRTRKSYLLLSSSHSVTRREETSKYLKLIKEFPLTLTLKVEVFDA